MPDPAKRLLDTWNRLHRWPGGSWLFRHLLTRMTPYTGTIRPEVVELVPGRAVVAMQDRRHVRNPFRSVHAVALANLGELASGLALTTALPAGLRAIVTQLTITFQKKARGRLLAESSADVPSVTDPTDFDVTARIRDADGDVVATVTATWRLDRAP